MRLILLLTIFILVLAQTGTTQVTVQSFNLNVPCCNTVDSVDIGNDGSYDFKVKSWFFFDAGGIDCEMIQSDLKLTYPQPIGQTFTNFYAGSLLAQTTIICYWNNQIWLPNTGHKYQGFQKINAPGDTTYGWIEYDFRGDASTCADTIYGIQLAYSTVPNVHLTAGQTTIVGTEGNQENESPSIYPNPAENRLHVKYNHELKNQAVLIYDLFGRIKYRSAAEELIDISSFSSGIYLIEVSSGSKVWKQRFSKK